MSIKFLSKLGLVFGLLFFVPMPLSAAAKLPPEVIEPYKAYRTALEAKDQSTARDKALEAWEAAEKHLGSHKTTGDLALNYATIGPTGAERNPFKNYEKRAKAFRRAIKLSSFYGEDAGWTEVERRLQYTDLELSVRRHKGFDRNLENGKTGRLGPLKDTQKAIAEHGLEGTTFDGDLHVLFARYYELNDNHEKAVEFGEKAIDIYENRTDGYFSQYAYFIHIFKGNSHFALGQKDDDIDEKIKAALEYQVVMQNLEGALPADHPFVKTAFTSWMKTRSVIEDAGKLEEAEAAGLCECWPFENYKNKPIPLKRKPPRLPRRADRSGKVWINFDLDADGKPYDIQVIESTSKIFEASAIKSVETWEYSKAGEEVDPKTREDIPVRIVFRLLDSRGNIVPE